MYLNFNYGDVEGALEWKFMSCSHVKSCVNKQASSWIAAQKWTTDQKPSQPVDPTLDMATIHKFPLLDNAYVSVLFDPTDINDHRTPVR